MPHRVPTVNKSHGMVPVMKSHRVGIIVVLMAIVGSTTCFTACGDDTKSVTPGPPIVPTQDEFRDKEPGEDRPILGPVQFSGVRVFAYRRALASGLMEVHDERVADASSARRTIERLKDTGWKAWPPQPAPELSMGFQHLAKDSMDCGYLLHISKRPTNWRRSPAKAPQCFATLNEVEKALDREEQIRFHVHRERWCAKKTPTFPPVRVPVENRCNIRVQLVVGELTNVEP